MSHPPNLVVGVWGVWDQVISSCDRVLVYINEEPSTSTTHGGRALRFSGGRGLRFSVRFTHPALRGATEGTHRPRPADVLHTGIADLRCCMRRLGPHRLLPDEPERPDR